MHPSTNGPGLPRYTKPPVIETILGLQFERLPGFTNGHLGAFWKTLDAAEWRNVSDAPPLQPQFEQFNEAARWVKGYRFELSPIPLGRLQIKNANQDRMIQVQNGRLHFNWLGQSGGEYPHFEAIRAEFDAVLQRFRDFITQADVGEFRPNQWEVTYINQIPEGTVWKSPTDWEFFLPLRILTMADAIVCGESFTGEWHFTIPEKRGRLHVEWQHGLKSDEAKEGRELIRITLTARGPLGTEEGNAPANFAAGLDLGREVIVRTFKSLMSSEANAYWGLENDHDKR